MSEGRIGSALDLVPVLEIIPEDIPEDAERNQMGTGAILVMKDGSFRMILKTGAVNFDLKGEMEQEAIVYGFGNLLMGLDTTFPIQILCHSRRLDPQLYLRQFGPRLSDPTTPEVVRTLIRDRIDHFQRQVRTYNMLQREFYVIVPWEGVIEPQVERAGDQIPMFRLIKALTSNAESKIERRPEPEKIAVARQQLDLRATQLESALLGMSVSSVKRLGEREVLSLLDEMYNPTQTERKRAAGVSDLQELQAGSAPADPFATPQWRRPDGDEDPPPMALGVPA